MDLQGALNRLWDDERPLLFDRGIAVAQELERRYDLDLPDEFRAYVIEGLPRADWMHESGIIWWAPERLKSLKDECGTETPEDQINPEIEVEADHYLVFADFLDWCGYAYAI